MQSIKCETADCQDRAGVGKMTIYLFFFCHTVFTAVVLALISLVDLRHLGQGVRSGAGVCEGNTYFMIADLRYCKVFHLVVHIYSIYLISCTKSK